MQTVGNSKCSIPLLELIRNSILIFDFFNLWYDSWYSDLLRDGQSGHRIAVGGREFSHPPDRAWGPPCPLYKWYRLCPVVQQPGCGADHPSTSSTEVIERAGLHSYSASKPSQSSNWGTETCAKRKSPSSCLLAIPAFDRVAGLYNRHLNFNRGMLMVTILKSD